MINVFKKGESTINKKLILEALEQKKQDTRQTLAIVDDEASGTLSLMASEGKLWQLLSSVMVVDKDRGSRYQDYDDMAEDPFIQSALEMYVDDATQYSHEMNATMWVASDHKYEDDINELFQTIGFENAVWGWMWNIAKYGDFFLGINAVEGQGIVSLDESIHPKSLNRIDINGKLAGFFLKEDGTTNTKIFPSSGFVHFISNYRPNFESVKIKILKDDYENFLRTNYPDYDKKLKQGVDDPEVISTNKESRKEINKRYMLNEAFGEGLTEDGMYVVKKVTSRYGTSILQSSRQVYKLLNLLEAMLAMARISRTPMIRVYYVNTEGMTPEERKGLKRDIEEQFKVKRAIDIPKNFYKEKYYPAGFNDDVVIPYTGNRGDMRIETIGGDVNIKDIVDIEYLRDKLFASLRIPKAFMGFEESLGTGNNLTRLDIRYARAAKKIQRSIIEGMYRMIEIHLAFKYGEDADISSLRLGMVPVSSAEEDSRIDIQANRASVFSSFIQATDQINSGDPMIDKAYFMQFLFESLFDFPGLDMNKLFSPSNQPKESKPKDTSKESKPVSQDTKQGDGGEEIEVPEDEPQESARKPKTGKELNETAVKLKNILSEMLKTQQGKHRIVSYLHKTKPSLKEKLSDSTKFIKNTGKG